MLNEVQKKILSLKKEKNAIILAHNYQPEEIQLIADFIGDSLELCIKSSEIKDKELVIFCGVDFMAETAAILNQNKKIIIPEIAAECPMAHMLKSEEIVKQKEKYPNAKVALYVNTLADAKAEADILVTSSNAVKVVESLESNQILFGPDNNLAKFVDAQTDKEIIPIPDGGHCYVHKMFHEGDIAFKKEEYPEAKLIIHPECDKEVQDLGDAVLSTGGMISYVKNDSGKEFIIGTEVDLITRINREVPEKTTYPLLDDAICKTMKLHTLEKVKNALENEEYVVKVDEKIAKKSLNAIERMIEVSKR
ncbi:quinolinate synthase NadA [Methanobrevibacter curvatus]|uniref:Quinolinate synthase n=1 Tax=Methanobrevibacter curvatus TaxID=49547 RepID=A0A166E428_9EURY|nr:quinolinate synthase NadA [Methanobrevibacter curvatus]KZX16258.1 quinolinate synthase A [Methanobrevibacter curvatus]